MKTYGGGEGIALRFL